jgi:ABC-2 type transport system permease protein
MPRTKVGAVAWREFKHTALTKAFIIGAVVFPIVVWGAFPMIVALTQQTVPRVEGTVAIIDPTGEVMRAAEIEFDPVRLAEIQTAEREQAAKLVEQIQSNPRGAIEVITDAEDLESLSEGLGGSISFDVTLERVPAEADLDLQKERVRAGSLLAVVEVPPGILDAQKLVEAAAGGAPSPALKVFTSADIRPVHTRLLNEKLRAAVVRARADRLDRDVELLKALVRGPRIETTALGEGGGEQEEATEIKEFLPFALVILMTICAFTSGQYLLTTTIEEKSNKVMEVLLSAVSPLQLMTGKILGQGLVSAVMLLMYGALAGAALFMFGTPGLVSPLHIACFFVYFLVAYFTTAATMASIGSAVNDMHDAQTLMVPAMMALLFLPMLLMFPASQDPTGLLATIFSFIPPVIPYVMMVRIAASEVPAWQIGLSMLIGTGSALGCLWMAAKIFRVGVLMYGKPPSPLEMIKWIRYS